jgi:hypothetical protein
VVVVGVAVSAGNDDCRVAGADEDLFRQPFSESSFWNTPLPATWDASAAVSDPRTADLRRSTIPSQDGVGDWPVVTWLNHRSFSLPVVTTDGCDPVVTLLDRNPDPREEPLVDVRIPTDASPAEGTDGHLLVVQPDGRTVVELFQAEKVDDATWSASRVEAVDLTGDGGGPDNGARAYGGSALGGLIRSWEVDPEHPDHTDGVIRHALAVALPPGMLLYTEGESGYDEEGYGTALGYVWPATEQDFNAPYDYYGTIPMGARLALPRSVDVDALGLGPEARAIAVALRDYGAYVVDRTGDDTVAFYAEVDAPSEWVEAALGPGTSGQQLDAIRSRLVVVVGD